MISRRGEVAAWVAIVALFLLIRLTLLVVREPFFDELFTVWMAGKPASAILPALLFDSGPPLYYFLARFGDVFALRLLSLLFATATLVLVLTRRSLGETRFIAAALLAAYPPAALFAADARAYALCGFFVACGVIAIHEQRPFAAAGALVLGAYTHWYGALFLPLLLLMTSKMSSTAPRPVILLEQRARGLANQRCRPCRLAKPRRRAFAAAAGAAVAFIPGLVLAWRQPREAIAWMPDLMPFGALPFAGSYPASLFASPSVVLTVLSAGVLVFAVWRKWTFAPAVLVPMLLVLGLRVYFPMRFESVLAAPLVLWIATGGRRAAAAILGACGLIAIALGIAEHQARPVDDYRQAALVLAANVKPGEPVVAAGYLYLEAAHQLGPPRVRAFPAGQGRHPGWRVTGRPSEELPATSFLWISERAAPETAALRGRQVRVLFENERAVVLFVHPARNLREEI